MNITALELKDAGLDNEDPAAQVGKALEELKVKLETKAANDNKLTERLDRLEAKLNRPHNGPANDNEPKLETKALNDYLRGGVASLNELERKTLNLGTTTAGGYIVAPQYSTSIIEGLTQFSPLRSLASSMTIGGTEIYIPTLTGNADGGWVTETGARPSIEPAFGQLDIKVFEYAAVIPVSAQLLEDSFVDLAGYLSRHITKRFAKGESTAFMVGDGNGKPTGLLHTPANYSQIAANQDGSDLLVKLIDSFYALPSEYASVGSWLMRRETMGIIRKLADGSTANRTIWSDSLANGTPATLLGRPVYEAVDMDPLVGTGSPATATFPIAFGDYASAYQIVDRVGVAIQRDDYTGADNGIVKLRARRRVGGKPVLPEAMVLIKAAA
ncbi:MULTISPECIES: phage major capsid protein [unclassified Bradyrhizobium]|uniref:phage major capsid protein n=1 Tax=unclassified Bradyrhizobium TaxID=2631580 RepID=UPI0029170FD6|nr:MULTISPECIES: phage major capsid protein [unclassified Bradyrhizobium]